MEEPPRISFRNGRLASRKAEEAAQRRFQAATWLEKMAGPLGLSSQPSEQEFISCLKSGLVLCNAINKIQPGAVPKVVTNQPLGLAWENQTLPAYQYFENIRNFLVAADELKIPSFEASDFERDTMEAGSVGKIVDCILGLKAYHEWKQFNKCNVPRKQVKSPLVSHKIQLNIPTLSSSAKCLNMSGSFEKLQHMEIDDQRIEGKVDSLVQTIADSLFGSKENIDHNVFHLQHQGTVDPMKLFNKIILSSLQEHKLKLVEDYMVEGNKTMEVCNSSSAFKNCSFSFGKELCNRWKLLGSQETELGEIKALLTEIKLDCAELQSQVQNDLTQIGNQVEKLSVAAVGYHRAIEENKNLHNMLQELKGNIRVFCRVRPSFVAGAKSSIDYIGNDGTLILLDPLKSQNARKVFQFNKVFGPNATQEEVYKETQSLIRSVMDGYNVCIFAYGQTGSGKTYSMCGPEIGSDKDVGINSKALNDLFQISCTRKDIKYEIHAQMVEIYNEQVRDLLSEEAITTKLEIRNCSSNGGLSLPDATMHFVQSTYDVINLMKVGEKNRAFSCTAMNNRSSRSHSVLTVHVWGRDVLGNTLQSSLHLVDLAGSERVDKSEVTGDRLKEAVHINKSLSCLGDVIAALAQKSSHIPYRNSKLTLLLQNSLGGHAKMLMLTHVSPEAESYNETISTLKFAQRVSTVELGAAHVNKESREIRDLWEQIDSLKRELATREREKSLHKIKENSSTSERSKQNEPTPPHQLLIKTPLPRPKINTEHSVTRLRRLSLEGSVHGKSQHQTKNSISDHQHSQIEEAQLKDVSREEINAKETIETCSAMPNLPSVSQLTNLGRTCGQLDEVSTPGADQIKLSSNTNSISKGSHIRKSLQTISKLINGSEKRHYQATSVVMPLKQERNLVSTKNSPSTLESRYKRRQSLTNVNSNETKESRRSSLGGKLVESYPRTLAFSASTMSSTKRWL